MVYSVLFLGTVWLGTPFSNASLMLNALDNSMNTKGSAYYILSKMLSPFCTYMFNSIFIPYFVYYATEFIVFERKSEKLRSKLIIYYIFFFFNAVLLPISKYHSIRDFFSVNKNKFIIQTVIDNCIEQSLFYLRYIIVSCFFSLCVVLLDVPHYVWIKIAIYFEKNGTIR